MKRYGFTLLLGLGLMSSSAFAADALNNTEWALKSLAGWRGNISTGTLSFHNGQVSGSDTCNLYSGGYRLSANRLSIAPGAGTLMACVGNSQQTSKLYRQALEQTTGYRRTSTTLTLTNARNQVVASFVKPVATLPGTQWQVGSYYNGASAIVSSINSERMTATFGENGQISGSGGCNHYSASYKFSAKAGTISISPPASTRMACAGADVMKEENLFFKALSSAKTFKRADNILELSNEHGIRVVTFRLKGK